MVMRKANAGIDLPLDPDPLDDGPKNRDKKLARRMRHDQRLKRLICMCLMAFLWLFAPKYRNRLDFSKMEWQDREIPINGPDGGQIRVDILVSIPFLIIEGQPLPRRPKLLFHCELDSRKALDRIRPQMQKYVPVLLGKYAADHEVLSLAIYMKVALEGEGTDEYLSKDPETNVASYASWPYKSFKGTKAFEFLAQAPNDPVAATFAAQMGHQEDQRALLKAETMRVILDAQLAEEERFFFLEAVDAALRLDDNLKKEFDQIRNSDPRYRRLADMTLSWVKDGLKEGRKQGLRAGVKKGRELEAREMILRMLPYRLTVTPEIHERIEKMPLEQLKEVEKALADPSISLTDVVLA